MKNLSFILVITVALSAVFLSCEKKTIDPGSYDTPYNPNALADSVRFSTNIIPIFQSRCLGCHDAGLSQPILATSVAYDNLTSTPGQYINLTDPAASLLYTTMVNTVSPHGSGPYPDEGAQVLIWIQQGAKNN
ncbi:MAG TPA: hypothetical protein PKI01_09020 [Bacteroidales bacterium]|nr:hypothetical protein [Bacteroidales bacterium]